MALPRDRNRHGQKVAVPQSGVIPESQYAGIPTVQEFNTIESAPTGAPSMVGKPVATFDVMPAGAKKFNVVMSAVLDGTAEGVIASFVPPIGYVAIVENWSVEFTGAPGGDSLEVFDLFVNLRYNGVVDPGNRMVLVRPFEGDKVAHIVVERGGKVDVEADWNTGHLLSQGVNIRFSGSLLLPNDMDDNFVELQVGEVRAV